MNREQIIRDDFPTRGDGYDRLSVDAHLAAVAAWAAALEAQITALQVERDALRRAAPDPAQDTFTPAPEPPDPTPEPAAPDPTLEPAQPEPIAVETERPLKASRSGDEVSARLVATRLALEGVEREQIREKLEATYDLEDADSLIDDVLERLA